MSDALLIDLDKMAEELHVAYEDYSSGGTVRKWYNWEKEELLRALERIAPMKAEGKPIHFFGAASQWMLAAIVGVTAPLLEAYVIPAIGARAELYTLPLGEPVPEGGVKFETRAEGNRVYVGFQCDDPTKPATYGPHNYDRALLPKVVLPAVGEDQELFLAGTGEFSIFMTFVKSYIGKCAAINVKDEKLGGYVYAWGSLPDVKIGDVR